MEPDTQVLVSVDDVIYRAYLTGENGYLMYLKTDAVADTAVHVEVYILNPNKCIQAVYTDLELPQ